MKTLPWFRLYAEFLTDPLMRMLAFEDQRHFVGALCMKAMGALDKAYPSPEIRKCVISSLLGLSARGSGTEQSALDAANTRLRSLGLVDENWQPVNWEKRQFRSDREDPTAAERMRRYRAHRNVTDVTDRNVPNVTATDTDTDTDTEKRERGRAKRSSRVPSDFVPEPSVALSQVPDLDVEIETQKFRDWEFKTPRSDWEAAWRNWVRRCKETGQYAKKGHSALEKLYPGYKF